MYLNAFVVESQLTSSIGSTKSFLRYSSTSFFVVSIFESLHLYGILSIVSYSAYIPMQTQSFALLY